MKGAGGEAFPCRSDGDWLHTPGGRDGDRVRVVSTPPPDLPDAATHEGDLDPAAFQGFLDELLLAVPPTPLLGILVLQVLDRLSECEAKELDHRALSRAATADEDRQAVIDRDLEGSVPGQGRLDYDLGHTLVGDLGLGVGDSRLVRQQRLPKGLDGPFPELHPAFVVAETLPGLTLVVTRGDDGPSPGTPVLDASLYLPEGDVIEIAMVAFDIDRVAQQVPEPGVMPCLVERLVGAFVAEMGNDDGGLPEGRIIRHDLQNLDDGMPARQHLASPCIVGIRVADSLQLADEAMPGLSGRRGVQKGKALHRVMAGDLDAGEDHKRVWAPFCGLDDVGQERDVVVVRDGDGMKPTLHGSGHEPIGPGVPLRLQIGTTAGQIRRTLPPPVTRGMALKIDFQPAGAGMSTKRHVRSPSNSGHSYPK
ncbi:hypothetical protein MKK51_19350 [Methylobacterium sp. E-045]|nr:hypothetical protein [Methylobacterium sp. E-045]MCJ2130989.1 hypothetical protein [Methylobacterium sp. E-045]